MPSVNTKRIEESATTALKAALLRCPILESYIDSMIRRLRGMGQYSYINLRRQKKKTLLVVFQSRLKGQRRLLCLIPQLFRVVSQI